MAQTPQQFFEKNMKWIALFFFCLFIIKSTQSCNRNMSLRATEKEYKNTVDSLIKNVDILKEENKQLSFELKLQSEKATSAEEKASAIQSAVEKTRYNTTTTVNVRGVQIDTIKK